MKADVGVINMGKNLSLKKGQKYCLKVIQVYST